MKILVTIAVGWVVVVGTAGAQIVVTPTAGVPSATATAPSPRSAEQTHPPHWSYEGKHGPEKWGSLDPAYAVCDKGKEQSPIDIAKAGAGTANPWTINYRPTSLKIVHHEHVVDIVDNGHTIQVNVDEGSTLTTSRHTYQLKQFHFHSPSEHTVDGKSFPLEVHFVHQSADGNFAVVGALFAEGPSNENLAKLIANFPKAKGDTVRLPEVKLDLRLHLPANTAAYTYMGSFTTPPCTENVEWLVFRESILASREQLRAFAARLSPNNRPVQPVNGRPITTTTVTGIGR
ncbi:MAG TPA: carbonic anhydrase family protein [Chthoniobacterales bacterium]|nr:carbonic anhydrase family protein [Chthoniobacterales bacterium]